MAWNAAALASNVAAPLICPVLAAPLYTTARSHIQQLLSSREFRSHELFHTISIAAFSPLVMDAVRGPSEVPDKTASATSAVVPEVLS